MKHRLTIAAVVVGAAALALAALALWPGEAARPPPPSSAGGGALRTPPPPVQALLADFQVSQPGPDGGLAVLGGVVRDPAGAPVPGAVVELFAPGAEGTVASVTCPHCDQPLLGCSSVERAGQVAALLRAGRGVPGPIAAATTAGGGDFRFPVPREALYFVRARDGAGRLAISDTVLVRDGDETLDVTLGAPVELAGVMQSADGGPIAGAQLLLANGGDVAPVEGASDQAGRFLLRCAPQEGSLWLYAEAQGYLPVVLTDLRCDAQDSSVVVVLPRAREVELLTVHGGRLVEAEVELRVFGEIRRLRAAGGRVVVGVGDDGVGLVQAFAPGLASEPTPVGRLGTPASVTLELLPAWRVLVKVLGPGGQPLPEAEVTLLDGHGQVEHVAPVSAEGLAVLGPLRPGEHVVEVTSPGHTRATRTVKVDRGDAHVAVTLQAQLQLGGTVLDLDGAPLPDGTLWARLGEARAAEPSPIELGRFALGVDGPGPWTLTVRTAAGIASKKVTAPARDLVLRLERGAGLQVKVRDEEGRPVMHAAVRVRDPTVEVPPVARNEDGEPDAIAASGESVLITDGEGAARAWGFLPGGYEVRVDAEGFAVAEVPVELAEGRAASVEVGLRALRTLTGVVVAETGRLPERGLRVEVFQTPQSRAEREAPVDPQGRFTVAGLVPAAEWKLALIADAWESDVVVVKAGHERGVRLVARPGLRVRGRVVGKDGAPLRDFSVDGQEVQSADGTFQVVVSRQRGSSLLGVQAERHLPTWVELRGEDVGTVRLEPLAAAEGRVVDEHGLPAPGARVSMGENRETTSGPDGTFRLQVADHSSGGPVAAERDGRRGFATWGAGKPVVIRLLGETLVTGAARDQKGQPWRDPVVATTWLLGGRHEFPVDVTGRFQGRLPAGLWSFEETPGWVEKTVLVEGERLEVTLGGVPKTCELVVEGPMTLVVASDQLVAMSPDLDPRDWPGGTVMKRERPHGPFALRGRKCDQGTLFAQAKNGLWFNKAFYGQPPGITWRISQEEWEKGPGMAGE